MAEIRRDRLIEADFVVRNDSAQARQAVEPWLSGGAGVDRDSSSMAWKVSSRALCPGLFRDLSMAVPLGSLTGSWAFAQVLASALSRGDLARQSVFRRSGCRFDEENASK